MMQPERTDETWDQHDLHPGSRGADPPRFATIWAIERGCSLAHIPLVDVVVVDEACREAIDGVLAESWARWGRGRAWVNRAIRPACDSRPASP